MSSSKVNQWLRKVLKVEPEVVEVAVEVIKEVPSKEVFIKFERKKLTSFQREALAVLSDPSMKPTKQAVYQLLDNYLRDLAEVYCVEGELKYKDILFVIGKFKDAVEKASKFGSNKKTKTKT